MSLFRRSRTSLAEDWEDIVERSVWHWRVLDEDERDRMADLIEAMVTTKRWEAANGFELTDEIRTVIAAQASLLVLGLGIDAYSDVSSVIVHPSSMRFNRTSQGPVSGTEVSGDVHLLGEATFEGPVVIAWDSAKRSARHPQRGHDVVFHEFAHQLDFADDVIDGTPPLHEPDARQRWIDVCTQEFDLLRRGEGGHLVDDYGATNPAEFFAVVTETFFNQAIDLEHEKPELYAVLADFYRQDTAARMRRATA